MNKIKITVIIPTCDRKDLLRKCLNCLAPRVQTLPADQYEVIVTDDGSDLTTKEMIRDQYLWARWVEGPRRGPAANRNNGATIASGEWLAFTDDDCLAEPSWLENFAKAITPGIFVYEGKTICKKGIHSPLYTAPINVTGGLLWSCNFMITKRVFWTLKGFDEQFPHPHLEDVDFRNRITANNYKFNFIPEAIIDHPSRPAGWGKKKALIEESHFYLFYKHSNTGPLRWKLLYKTLRFRYNAIKQHPFGFDSLRAVGLVAIEVLFYLAYSGKWETKYVKQFKGSRSVVAHN